MIKLSDSAPTQGHRQSLLRIGQVAALYALSLTTIRRATDSGALKCLRLPVSGARRFAIDDVERWLGRDLREESSDCVSSQDVPIGVIARVSSSSQSRPTGEAKQSSLQHQIDRVESYAIERWGRIDKRYFRTSSGLNYDDPVFCRMIQDIISGELTGGFLVAQSFDRICRFGIRMIEILCQKYGVTIVYTMTDREAMTENESITFDVLSVLQHYCSRASGAKARAVLKVNLPPELLRECWELYCNQYTYKDIAKHFKKKGVKVNGHDLTAHIIKTNLRENEAILSQEPVKARDSFSIFVSECVRKRKGGRLSFKQLEARYGQWCRERGEYQQTRRKVTEAIRELGWDRHLLHKMVVYWGLELA